MIVLLVSLIICFLTVSLFLYTRIKKGGVEGVVTKALASLSFILLAVFLSSTKTGLNIYNSYAVSCIIAGLVCGLIGDILLDLKVIYPFHQNKYLTFGMTSFGLGHLFYISALILFSQNAINLFAEQWLSLLIIVAVSILLTAIIYFASIKILKFNFEGFAKIVNAYTFILLFATALSIFLSFLIAGLPMFILAIGFVLFLLSDLVLSMQYFGGKQDDKSLIFINHFLYYLAQIAIAMFIFFI
ncbi:MAG: hypothetical protein EOM55_02540 [Clostridia bacterium]|nr:hypothetical protein [Clostridia bacterium]